jgi:hypothetical protein
MSERPTGRVRAITWSTTGTGSVTGVAEVDPISIGGVSITRLSLGSTDEATALGVAVGDTIEVDRTGVIPRVASVVTRTGAPIALPSACPACASTLTEGSDEAGLRCTNAKCPPVAEREIERWLRLAGVRDSHGDIRRLVEAKVLSEVRDLYELEPEHWVRARLPAERSVALLAGLRTHPPIPLADVMRSLRLDSHPLRHGNVERAGYRTLADLLEDPDLEARAPEITEGTSSDFRASIEAARPTLTWMAAPLRTAPLVAMPPPIEPDVEAKLSRCAGLPISPNRFESMGARARELRDKLGFELPDDFFALWELACRIDSKTPSMAFNETLGIGLGGLYDVMSGAVENAAGRSILALDRSYMDPPELFTVWFGNTDGEHGGYWVDDPNERPSWLASYFNNDPYEPAIDGRTLFDVVRGKVESARFSLSTDMVDEEETQERLEELARMRERITEYATEDRLEQDEEYMDTYDDSLRILRRTVTNAATREGAGIVVPREKYRRPSLVGAALRRALAADGAIERLAAEAREALAAGFSGTALEIAKALWCLGRKGREPANLLLVESYRALGRPLLADVVEAHHRAVASLTS